MMLLEARRGRPKGWRAPNPKYIQRITTPDGKYKYVYYRAQALPPTRATTKLGLQAYVHNQLQAQMLQDINLNKRGRSAFGCDAQGTVIVGAPNLLGRHYYRNASFVPLEKRKPGQKLRPGQAYLGVIAGYTTTSGAVQRDAYVYPLESVKEQLAREAAQFHNLDERLARVHAWADKHIVKRSAVERQTALCIKILHDTKERIGGGGGQSIPKKALVSLQRQKVKKSWSMDTYVSEREALKEDTFGVLDIQKQHVTWAGDVAHVSYVGKAHQRHDFKLNLPEVYRNQLKVMYHTAKSDTSPLFTIKPSVVGAVYTEVGDGLTPHKERHAHAQRVLKDTILARWRISDKTPVTAQLKKLRETFYKQISVPLGHKNKSHAITTALNSYVGLELRNAYTGLVDRIRQTAPKRSIKESEDAKFTPADWLRCMTSVLIKAALARAGLLSVGAAQGEVMLV